MAQGRQDDGAAVFVAKFEVDQGFAAHDRQRHQAVGLAVVSAEDRSLLGRVEFDRHPAYHRPVVAKAHMLGAA
jgi:hypothetical protein